MYKFRVTVMTNLFKVAGLEKFVIKLLLFIFYMKVYSHFNSLKFSVKCIDCNYQFQNAPPGLQNPALDFSEEIEIEEALCFTGETEIGGMFGSVISENAAAYFAGYIALRMHRHHLQLGKGPLNACTGCNVLVPQADVSESFTSFKQYSDYKGSE